MSFVHLLLRFRETDECSNQWAGMFGSRSTDVASQLPLWAVQFDKTPGVNSVTTFMGGWTSAVAKQYYLGRCSYLVLVVIAG